MTLRSSDWRTSIPATRFGGKDVQSDISTDREWMAESRGPGVEVEVHASQSLVAVVGDPGAAREPGQATPCLFSQTTLDACGLEAEPAGAMEEDRLHWGMVGTERVWWE